MKTWGIDLGTNSIGWSVIETDGEPGEKFTGKILGIGSRIFSQSEMAGRDAKSKISLAVARREARSQRRQRDRRLKRKSRLLEQLIEFGLMPRKKSARKELIKDTDDGAKGDLSKTVLALRVKALREPLAPYELGRVLFQLNQRRGFKSNRKADTQDNEAGKIAIGSSRLQQAMDAFGAKTYGEFLYKRRLEGKTIRTRLRPESMAEFNADENAKGDGYDFFPTRAELERELDLIIQSQMQFHKNLLSEERTKTLRETIVHQRPLLPQKIGKCSYNPNEFRCAKAHPLFQEFRLYKEINELEIIDDQQNSRKLTADQRDALVLKLRGAKTASFSQLRKVLKLSSDYSFNKESENRTKLEGNVVAAALSAKPCFGPSWNGFSIEKQWEIIGQLKEEEDPDRLRIWLNDNCNLSDEQITAVEKVKLPDGHGRMGVSALSTLLDALKNDFDEDGKVITEARAAKNAYGRTNSEDDPNRESFSQLPKYQEILERHIPPGKGSMADKPHEKDPNYDHHMGKITNPTVHIALNQLRRLINSLIKEYGKPDRISIEIGRELKLSDKQRDEMNKTIGKNTREAEARGRKLEEEGFANTGYNRLRLKLWEELNSDPINRVCIYSGKPMGIRQVFSNEVEIDHILPYSKTMDDGFGNKILCFADANKNKRNRAPAEVIEWHPHYGEILSRATVLPKNKQWRFGRDAMKRFEGENDFAARQLTDTQYLSRMAGIYLKALYPAEEADENGVLKRINRVRVLPGRTTEMLRRNWHLNDVLPDHNFSETIKLKNRKDHRHHAVDAFVIACTSRSMIQKIASSSEEIAKNGSERILSKIPEPWEGFRNELRQKVNEIIVSHKPDHGTISKKGQKFGKDQTAKQLHNDTAYGFTDERDEKGKPQVVTRKPLDFFTSEKSLMMIRDQDLRDFLWEATRGLSGKEFSQALLDVNKKDKINGQKNPYKGLRHIRILETLNVIPIHDDTGKAYKGYKGDSNYRFDVWRLLNGKWISEVVSTFDIHQPNWQSKVRAENPTAKKLLSLQQNDMVAIERDGERLICRVVKFAASGVITLAQHNEGGALKARDTDKEDPFKYINTSATGLCKLFARQIRIDEMGRVFDPGPRK